MHINSINFTSIQTKHQLSSNKKDMSGLRDYYEKENDFRRNDDDDRIGPNDRYNDFKEKTSFNPTTTLYFVAISFIMAIFIFAIYFLAPEKKSDYPVPTNDEYSEEIYEALLRIIEKKVVYANDSSFCVTIPESFIKVESLYSSVIMQYNIPDSIDLCIYTNTNISANVFNDAILLQEDSKIIPIHRKGFEDYGTTKTYDSEENTVYYHQYSTKGDTINKDEFFYSYQQKEDGRNYLISITTKSGYKWDLSDTKFTAQSLKTFTNKQNQNIHHE